MSSHLNSIVIICVCLFSLYNSNGMQGNRKFPCDLINSMRGIETRIWFGEHSGSSWIIHSI